VGEREVKKLLKNRKGKTEIKEGLRQERSDEIEGEVRKITIFRI